MIAQLQIDRAEPSAAAEKEQDLRRLMREMGTVLVAYSGGVDSAYLSAVATQELGPHAKCVMGLSPSVSTFQRSEGANIALANSFNFSTIQTGELKNEDYKANAVDRCYFCKSELYGELSAMANSEGFAFVVDGTNADDVGDHRPGRQAAAELSVRSPLVEVGLTKSEIRKLSQDLGLSSWDKPASPCLSSRIAHGVPVTIERLSKVEKGEEFLRSASFREFRVRVHGDLVRIEISPIELGKALNLEMAGKLTEHFRSLGFRYVTLDLEGFRSGAMIDPAKAKVSDQNNQKEQLEKV